MVTEDSELLVYAIYKHPTDYPDVCRIWHTDSMPPRPDKNLFAQGKTLKEIRAKLPPGLTCRPRWKNDDPAILEIWF